MNVDRSNPICRLVVYGDKRFFVAKSPSVNRKPTERDSHSVALGDFIRVGINICYLLNFTKLYIVLYVLWMH